MRNLVADGNLVPQPVVPVIGLWQSGQRLLNKLFIHIDDSVLNPGPVFPKNIKGRFTTKGHAHL
ncbi:hypothetical protein SDC9_194379 [bioreactor metagenome]|uniref:Uncharacterized protein n=1 Tax=bioreactor metagenome TaxID=1076179 RepID=A0A645I649_9ZZZZ